MTTINEQLKKPYVGEVVELWDIDLTPIGGTEILHLTPSGNNITWKGNEYTPFPMMADNKARDLNGAPGRFAMRVGTGGQMFAAYIAQYGDMVGAEVSYTKTFSMYLDGEATADPLQHFPIQSYIILQKAAFSPRGIEFLLGTQLDRPGLLLPRRQVLRDNIGNRSLYCPGVSRSGMRRR